MDWQTIETYGKLVKAWLCSTKVGNETALQYAVETIAALFKINLTGPVASLLLPILLGVIEGNTHHDPVTAPDGTSFPAGPAVTPAHAVAVAASLATSAAADMPEDILTISVINEIGGPPRASFFMCHQLSAAATSAATWLKQTRANPQFRVFIQIDGFMNLKYFSSKFDATVFLFL